MFGVLLLEVARQRRVAIVIRRIRQTTQHARDQLRMFILPFTRRRDRRTLQHALTLLQQLEVVDWLLRHQMLANRVNRKKVRDQTH